MTAGAVLRPMTAADAADVLRIYAEGIATGDATFEAEAPGWAAWDAAHAPEPRLTAEVDGAAAGWAALKPTSVRRVYRGVGEVILYVAAAARGHGLGRALLTRLIADAERCGFWSVRAGIFPENAASIRLHLACGFREVGRFERVGYMRHGARAGTWRDTVLLERRSAVVGTEGDV